MHFVRDFLIDNRLNESTCEIFIEDLKANQCLYSELNKKFKRREYSSKIFEKVILCGTHNNSRTFKYFLRDLNNQGIIDY